MTNPDNDMFNASELYLLARAFDAETIVGLPDKRIFQLLGNDIFEAAYRRLANKGFFTEQGKLTENGYVVIKALQQYCQSDKYVRINQATFAFRKDAKEELIILYEPLDGSEKYKLLMFSKDIAMGWLNFSFPFIAKEPKEDPGDFVKKPLLHREKHELDDFEPEYILDIESFDLDNKKPKQRWLIFEKDEKLISVNTEGWKYYYASQKWLKKMLLNELSQEAKT